MPTIKTIQCTYITFFQIKVTFGNINKITYFKVTYSSYVTFNSFFPIIIGNFFSIVKHITR